MLTTAARSSFDEKMNSTIDWDITTTQAPTGLTGRMELPTVIITGLE